MKIAVRPLFMKRKRLEQWLSQMAAEGWLFQDMSFLIFQGFGAFQFQEYEPKRMQYAVYELRHAEERQYWMDAGWRLRCEKDSLLIYESDDETSTYPIVQMPERIIHRFLKSCMNLSFLLILLLSVRMEETLQQRLFVFFGCLFLLTLPNMIGLRGTIHEMRIVRVMKNIVYALLWAGIISMFIFLMFHIVRNFFG